MTFSFLWHLIIYFGNLLHFSATCKSRPVTFAMFWILLKKLPWMSIFFFFWVIILMTEDASSCVPKLNSHMLLAHVRFLWVVSSWRMVGIWTSLRVLLFFLTCLWCLWCNIHFCLAHFPGWPIHHQYILNLLFLFFQRGLELCNKLIFKILSGNNYFLNTDG